MFTMLMMHFVFDCWTDSQSHFDMFIQHFNYTEQF